MAIDVFKSVVLTIRGWHQLHHTIFGMTANAWGFVKALPAFKIVLNIARNAFQHVMQPNVVDQLHHVVDRNKRDQCFVGGVQVNHISVLNQKRG